jgi:hypothetical protein
MRLIHVTALFCLVLGLTQAGCQTGPRPLREDRQAQSATPEFIGRDATLAYWNSLNGLEQRCSQTVTNLLNMVVEENPQLTKAQMMVLAAEKYSEIINEFLKAICALPVRNVDQRLIAETTDDMRYCTKFAREFKGMAESLNAYAEWSKGTSIPASDESFLTDILDSFIMGLRGQPFAGYDKMKNDAARLGGQGEQIATQYLSHLEALNTLIQEADEQKIKELELRQYLTIKYDVEFPSSQTIVN